MRIYSLSDAPTPLGGYMAIDDANDGTKKVAFNTLADNVVAVLGGDPVTVAHGGTGAATAAAARANLGVGSISTPAAGATFDSLTTPGFYWINLSTVTGGPESTGYGVLAVYGTSVIMQQFTLQSTTVSGVLRSYTRFYANSQWYSWMTVAAPVVSGTVTGNIAGSGNANVTIDLPAEQPNTNYIIAAENLAGFITIGIQAKTVNSFKMYLRNNSASQQTATIRWTLINAPAPTITTAL